jgi:hypothetical protein
MSRGAAFAVVLVWVSIGRAQAQRAEWIPAIRGYLLNVPVASAEGPLSDQTLADAQRLRLMTRPTLGQFSLDLAYEHVITLRSEPGGSVLGGLVPTGSGGDWVPLQGSLWQTDHVDWRHRVDRLAVRYAMSDAEVTVGRQPVSWATTLFLTPADPFVPFDPSDPFREYRSGVDAVRVRAFPGAFSEVDGVLRVADSPTGETLTAAGRARAAIGSWEVAGWVGVVHGEPALSAAATVGVFGAIVRTESVVRRTNDETVLRATVGVDRSFVLLDRNVYLVLEYQRDGFGAASGDDLLAVFLSEAAQRGELQVFGRDEVAVQASMELHPLVGVSALVLWNLNDASALLGPGASYSAGNELSVRGGVFLGVGDGATPAGLPASEFGVVPTTVYMAVSWFF